MINLEGYIEQGLSYRQIIKDNLPLVDFEHFDVNKHIKVLIKVEGESIAICKWVSPKRTRSYPYARVYDILSQDASKKVAIIPVIKDEGKIGDRDFLQWDTVSLLSLLNVFIIPAYYCDADIKGLKLTNQRFEPSYVKDKLLELSAYRSTALHWNINEFKSISNIVYKALECYKTLSRKYNIELHNEEGMKDFINEILNGLENFIKYSRNKAQKAQNREVSTVQPKERISYSKAKINIFNYLGGVYHFTVDEIIISQDEITLIESKHSKNKTLPSVGDIKDALLKIMLYKSLNRLVLNDRELSIKIALKITTEKKNVPNSLEEVINSLKGKGKCFYKKLLEEAKLNKFEIYYHAIG